MWTVVGWRFIVEMHLYLLCMNNYSYIITQHNSSSYVHTYVPTRNYRSSPDLDKTFRRCVAVCAVHMPCGVPEVRSYQPASLGHFSWRPGIAGTCSFGFLKEVAPFQQCCDFSSHGRKGTTLESKNLSSSLYWLFDLEHATKFLLSLVFWSKNQDEIMATWQGSCDAVYVKALHKTSST